MESRFNDQFKMETTGWQTIFNNMDVVFNEWEKNMTKHEDTVKGLEFALDYRAAEAYTINQKLEHIQE